MNMSTSTEKGNAAGNDDHAKRKVLAVHLTLVEEFLQFCKNKKGNSDNFPLNFNVEPSRGNTFKEKVVMYFGEYLPSDVIDELCKLVDENSYGKCHFCMLPVESLVLSVLQTLLDASKKILDAQDGNCPMKSTSVHVPYAQNTQRTSHVLLFPSRSDHQHEEAGTRFQYIGEDTILSVDSQGEFQEAICLGNQDTHNLGIKVAPIIEAPRGKNARKVSLSMSTVHQEPAVPCKKRLRQDRPANLIHAQGGIDPSIKVAQNTSIGPPMKHDNNNSLKQPFIRLSPQFKVTSTSEFKNRCSNLGEKTDQMYSNKYFSKPVMNQANHETIPSDSQAGKGTTSVFQNASVPKDGLVCRFPVSDKELQYYKIICGLAHSQWRTFPSVEFFKTTVTYQSLGQSVEPHGYVDNFFVAALCRKYFEDHHPRHSKKHYFYPRVGVSLMSYCSLSDVQVVKNSFLGANSAHKLHLSHKLCFPIYHGKHWFVFVVDLKNKYFAFLDSLYDQNDMYQIHVRDKLVASFKDCWYEHAEVKLDLEDFEILYPPAPKQSNLNDCGIFAVMFLELWDVTIDLRQLFDFSDVPNIRVKLANSLFFSSTNLADKTLVNGFYEQGLDPRLCK